MPKSEKKSRRRKEAGGGGKRLSLASPSCTTNTINLGAPTAISNAIMTSSASSNNNYSSTPPPSLSPIPHRSLVYSVCLLGIATIQRVCNFFIVHTGGVLVVLLMIIFVMMMRWRAQSAQNKTKTKILVSTCPRKPLMY